MKGEVGGADDQAVSLWVGGWRRGRLEEWCVFGEVVDVGVILEKCPQGFLSK